MTERMQITEVLAKVFRDADPKLDWLEALGKAAGLVHALHDEGMKIEILDPGPADPYFTIHNNLGDHS